MGQSREAAAFFNQSRPLCGRFRANGTGLTEPGSDILIAVAVRDRSYVWWNHGVLRPMKPRGCSAPLGLRRPVPPGEADSRRPAKQTRATRPVCQRKEVKADPSRRRGAPGAK